MCPLGLFLAGKIPDVTAHSASTGEPRIVGDDTSPVRLHGQACIHCGTSTGPLTPAGQVGTRVDEGVVRVWEVVSCSEHKVTAS